MARQLPTTAVSKRGKVQSEAAPDITETDMDKVAKEPRKSLAKKLGGRSEKPKRQPVPAKKKPTKGDFKAFSGLYNKNEAANG